MLWAILNNRYYIILFYRRQAIIRATRQLNITGKHSKRLNKEFFREIGQWANKPRCRHRMLLSLSLSLYLYLEIENFCINITKRARKNIIEVKKRWVRSRSLGLNFYIYCESFKFFCCCPCVSLKVFNLYLYADVMVFFITLNDERFEQRKCQQSKQ